MGGSFKSGGSLKRNNASRKDKNTMRKRIQKACEIPILSAITPPMKGPSPFPGKNEPA